MNKQFPKSDYVVKGYADFYTEPLENGQPNYEIQVEIDFEVIEE